MAVGCFAGLAVHTDKTPLVIASLSLAVAALVLLKKFKFSTKTRVGLIYLHLIFLFFPFVLMATAASCDITCLPCSGDFTKLIILTLPTTLIASTIAGFFLIPGIYMLFSKKSETENKSIRNFVMTYALGMYLKMPKIYILDNVTPIAFSFKSFRPMIFLAAGLLDILNKKEIEAVLLHELAHLKRRDSLLTFSTSLMRFFSPLSLLARFHYDSYNEEKHADKFAAKIQGTEKYLKSTKGKIDIFERTKKYGELL